MKKLFFKFLAFTLLSGVIVSCEKGDEVSDSAESYQVLVVNQGNYSEANGSLSVIDKNGVVRNGVYEVANPSNEGLAAIVESAVDCGSKWALLCNSEDKIEFVDKVSFKSLSVVKGILTPRYGVYKDGFLFVTSADMYQSAPSGSNLYKIDLASYNVVDTLHFEGCPEGIISYDNYLWVALSASYNPATYGYDDAAVERISLTGNKMRGDLYTLKGVGLQGRHLAADKQGNIWVSLAGFGAPGAIAKVDTSAKTLTDKVEIDQFYFPGHIYTTSDGDGLYYMTTDGYSAGAADENTSIKILDLTSRSSKTVASGNGFYGFNVNPSDKKIYTANVSGFATNSVLYIYDENGNKTSNDDLLGVGACRFLFVK